MDLAKSMKDNMTFTLYAFWKKLLLLNVIFLYMNFFIEYGGLGLDYSYSVAVGETLGHVNCGAIPMAIGVQTDMATPALAR